MRPGNEIEMRAVAFGRPGMRRLAILLALLLIAAGMFFAAPAGQAQETEPFTLDFTCPACTVNEIAVLEPEEGFFADIDIDVTGAFQLVLTAKGKGPPPGRAFVVKHVGGVDIRLPRCTGKAPINCVTINRVAGHTQWTVKFDGDPRLKFGP